MVNPPLSLPPGLWLTSPAGWLPRTGISSGTLRSVIEYELPFYMAELSVNARSWPGPSSSELLLAAVVSRTGKWRCRWLKRLGPWQTSQYLTLDLHSSIQHHAPANKAAGVATSLVPTTLLVLGTLPVLDWACATAATSVFVLSWLSVMPSGRAPFWFQSASRN